MRRLYKGGLGLLVAWIALGCSKDTTVESSATCALGQHTCRGDDLLICNANRSGWDLLKTCAPGACQQGDSDCADPDGGVGGIGGAAGQAGSSGQAGESGQAGATNGGSGGSSGAAGGSAGSSGGGGNGGSAGVCDSDGVTVTQLAQAPIGDGTAYGIDPTEVTNGQYCAWLKTTPDPTDGQPSECAWNTDFTPANEWPQPSSDKDYPVRWVDWCDAYAYCKSVGKRLCGKIKGGPVLFSSYADQTVSQWHNACSSGGQYVFPYGNSFEPQTCNGDAYANNQVQPVGSATDCHAPTGPLANVYDLSGNAREWEDACSGSDGATDICRVRGGSNGSDESQLRCDSADQSARGTPDDGIGFRCCSDP